MKIKLNSVMVDDQDKALKFYTEVPGFVKKPEIPVGEFRRLTLAAPGGGSDVELVLEPMGFPPARACQKSLFAAGIPLTAFETDDVRNEYARMKKPGVAFRGEPQSMGPVTSVLFEDTCGNLINLYQVG